MNVFYICEDDDYFNYFWMWNVRTVEWQSKQRKRNCTLNLTQIIKNSSFLFLFFFPSLFSLYGVVCLWLLFHSIYYIYIFCSIWVIRNTYIIIFSMKVQQNYFIPIGIVVENCDFVSANKNETFFDSLSFRLHQRKTYQDK